jgi:hypothetical protein
LFLCEVLVTLCILCNNLSCFWIHHLGHSNFYLSFLHGFVCIVWQFFMSLDTPLRCSFLQVIVCSYVWFC